MRRSRRLRRHGGGDRRLCMVVHAYYPVGEPRVQREAKAAAEAGYQVEVVCLRRPGEPKREVIEGIEVHRLGLTHRRGASLPVLLAEYVGFALLASAYTMWLRLKSPAPSEHIVQVHAPPEFLVVAGIGPKLLGSKLVLDIHDLSKHLYGARFAASRPRAQTLSLGLRLIERVACALADQVITVHEPYRAELVANHVAASRVTVIMNSADEDVIAHASENGGAETSRDGTGHPFTLAYHGTITPAYGVDLIVEALPLVLQHVPDARCVILGEGDGLPLVRARAAELGLTDRIEFSGSYLPLVDALRRVAAADCGVIPNRPIEINRFALSSKLFEYVALGVPAVVAGLQTLQQYFAADDVRFFKAGDSAALADAIIWVALNPQEARARATAARARSQDYSWTSQRARYLDLLTGR